MNQSAASSGSIVSAPERSPEAPPPRSPLPLWKRGIDLTCCFLALPVLALCTLFAAILTRLASRGPIFFQQERVGHGGRRFRLYKFRTMHVSAPTVAHEDYVSKLIRNGAPMQKLDVAGDSRLIPGGWLLRASGLDELPQIINVLRGEMSLVGPRPSIPYEYDQYTNEQRRRNAALPGLTGLWQVSGKNRLTFDEMIGLDIKYAESFSLGLDVKIILRTVPALVRQISDTRRAKAEAKRAASPALAAGAPPVALIDESELSRPRSFSSPPFLGNT